MTLMLERESFSPSDDQLSQDETSSEPGLVRHDSGDSGVSGLRHDISKKTIQNEFYKLEQQQLEPAHTLHTPNYSRLCIVAMFFNPVLGAVAYLLNHRAQMAFRTRSLNQASFLYWCAMCLSSISIFVTVSLVLLIPVLKPLPIALQYGCDEAYTEEDMDRYNRVFGIDKTTYCGIMQKKNGVLMYPFLIKILDECIEFPEPCNITSITRMDRPVYHDGQNNSVQLSKDALNISSNTLHLHGQIRAMIFTSVETHPAVDTHPDNAPNTHPDNAPNTHPDNAPNIVKEGELHIHHEVADYGMNK